jgi:uncharacterized coiled-coil protein SlyX
MTADKPRINPIVPERDDMIGRSPTASSGSSKSGSMAADSRRSGGGSGGAGSGGYGSGGSAASGTGGWKALILVMLVALVGMSWFGYMQFTNHNNLQQRFNALESRLSSTDESVTQSGAALQLKLSKQGDELEKHWSEIKKLWGVTNDINKGKIAENKKDIAFLASKRTAIEKSVADLSARVDKENRSLTNLSGNYLAISADIDAVNANMRKLTDKLNGLQGSLTNIDRQLKANAEAIESMDAFRRQTNQKMLDLERRTPAAAVNVPSQ